MRAASGTDVIEPSPAKQRARVVAQHAYERHVVAQLRDHERTVGTARAREIEAPVDVGDRCFDGLVFGGLDARERSATELELREVEVEHERREVAELWRQLAVEVAERA